MIRIEKFCQAASILSFLHHPLVYRRLILFYFGYGILVSGSVNLHNGRCLACSEIPLASYIADGPQFARVFLYRRLVVAVLRKSTDDGLLLY